MIFQFHKAFSVCFTLNDNQICQKYEEKPCSTCLKTISPQHFQNPSFEYLLRHKGKIAYLDRLKIGRLSTVGEILDKKKIAMKKKFVMRFDPV